MTMPPPPTPAVVYGKCQTAKCAEAGEMVVCSTCGIQQCGYCARYAPFWTSECADCHDANLGSCGVGGCQSTGAYNCVACDERLCESHCLRYNDGFSGVYDYCAVCLPRVSPKSGATIGSHIGAPWLSEETFAIAREEADARGQTIDAVVKNALAQYRLQRLGMLSLTLTRDEE